MATWATEQQARDQWSDAPVEPALLNDLLDSAQEVAEVYAPALPDGADVPKRYTRAVILQAREHWLAMERDGDVLGFDAGDYAIRVRPLTGTVKSLLRPRRGRPKLFRTPGATT